MRVAIGGISHESSTFSVVPTTLDDFAQRSLIAGPALVDQYQGTRTCPGGFIDAGRDFAFSVASTVIASAVPGGPVTAEATRELTRRLCEGLRRALQEDRLDGVLLALHGAMVSELDDDGERYVLRRVREVIVPEIPIVVTLDLHGNISPEMVRLVNAAVAYDEYPHTDTWQRGYEAWPLDGPHRARWRAPGLCAGEAPAARGPPTAVHPRRTDAGDQTLGPRPREREWHPERELSPRLSLGRHPVHLL